MTARPAPGAVSGAGSAGTMPDSPRRARKRPEPTPAQRALGLLVRREHSRLELERKLAARGVAPEEAARAVERMAAEGWQDNARFAASLARSRAGSGYGPLRIRIELESHGLDAGMVESAFAALAEDGEDDWDARARDLVERRFGEFAPGDAVRQRKAAEFLIRRGFGIGSARRATGFDPVD